MPAWPWDKPDDASPQKLLERIRELETEREKLLAAVQRSDEAIVLVKNEHEMRVRERTVELTTANEALRSQILERKRAESELRQLNAYLDSIIENIPDMIFLKDAKELRFVRFNRAGEELLGYSREELLGKNDHDFFPKAEAEFFISKDRETLADGKMLDISEEPIQTRHKGLRVLHTKKIPILDREGRPLYLLGISEDITDKKNAEEELRFTHVLRQSNIELEQFAYVASHDLQEPLRKVMAFGDLLKVECHETLPEKGRDYIDRMQRAVARMQELIEALLAYSRVSREQPQMADVDLNEVVRGVLGDLELHIARAKAGITVETLPAVRADRHRMRQLFQNLISNGIKFCEKSKLPVIKIREVPASRPGMVAVEIHDEGIGFDSKHTDRIFQPFERLHGREDYEGTGVGLAICQRIILRHGGQIKAESRPGAGTQFIVELHAASHKDDMA
jgi:PAS domain S-box-containing protein